MALSKDRIALLQDELKGTRIPPVPLLDELAIHESTINEHLAEQPTLYAWYGTMHAQAIGERDDLKRQLEIYEADLDRQLRESWDEKVQGKLTEKALNAQIVLNPAYQKAYRAYLDAKRQEEVLKVLRDAFQQRKDVLITLATNLRNQFDTDLGKKVATITTKRRTDS